MDSILTPSAIEAATTIAQNAAPIAQVATENISSAGTALIAALSGGASSALTRSFEGPFKMLDDLWFEYFGYKTALRRRKREIENEVATETYRQEIQSALEKIPEENRIEPKRCVVGPAMEASKHFVDEPELRKMFVNLIAAASDSRKYMNAHPRFTTIIQNLSPFEGQLIKETNILRMDSPCCSIRFQQNNTASTSSDIFTSINEGYEVLSHFIAFDNKPLSKDEVNLYSIAIENLLHLELAMIPNMYTLTDNAQYDIYRNLQPLHEFLSEVEQTLKTDDYQNYSCSLIKQALIPTSFGKLFYQVCVENK